MVTCHFPNVNGIAFLKNGIFPPFRTLKLLDVKMIRSITVLDMYHLFSLVIFRMGVRVLIAKI